MSASILGSVALGCGSDGDDSFNVTMRHDFDPLLIDVAEETRDVCQSWALDNDEPLYVHKVRQSNGGGWHHSNWFFVPERVFPPNEDEEGPDATLDGTWDCDARGFSEYGAAGLGGAFFFQSTQTLSEVQAFPEGAAIVIPPRSMVVGSIHLLNISGAPLETSMSFDVETLPQEEVEVPLSVISYQISDLVIPPAVDGVPQESRTILECDLRATFERWGQPFDYSIYYVLSHYHEWGNYFSLSFVSGEGELDTIFEVKNSVGEPLGQVIDPPHPSSGSTRLREECGFLNDTDRILRRGFAGQEMCDFIAYTDTHIKVGTGGGDNHAMGVNEDGIPVFEVDCPESGITALP